MRKLTLALVLSCLLLWTGCLGKYPNFKKELSQLKKNLQIIKADYEPLKDKGGKVIDRPAHRPFGADEGENKKSRKNRLNLIGESDKLCDDMISASGK